MTLRAIGGLLVLNVGILGAGAGALWGVRGWRWWTEFARLVGVAYFLGLGMLTILTMYELVLGVPFGSATMLLSGIGVGGAGVVVGWLRGFAAPGLHEPGWRFPKISLFAALFVAGIAVYLEALFRADRLAGIAREWDSWANWVPKSESLYLSGRLDLDFLALSPQLGSYPPGPTMTQAAAFHAMGSADTVTLHVQYWFFAAAFVVAVIGLLSQRVHQAILFPLLLAFLVAPSFLDWVTTVYADVPMGYFVALSALLVFLWIDERKAWHLTAGTVFLSGAMLTKREGILFAACVLFAGFAASFADRRRLWPRLLAAGLAAYALVLPWTIWFTAQGLPATGSDTGYVGVVSSLDRVWPALRTTLETLFDRDLWHFAPFLAIAAIVLALLGGARRVSLYAGAFLAAGVTVVTWILWVNHGIALIHDDWAIRRFVGTLILVLAVLTPVLLQRAWEPVSRVRAGSPGVDALFGRSRVAWVIVLVGVLSHPGAMLLGYSGSGLPGGGPSFPGSAGCVSAPAPGGKVRVVVGYADSYPKALELRSRAVAAGLYRTAVAQDGCGRLRVSVDGVETVAESRPLLSAARRARLEPTLEADAG